MKNGVTGCQWRGIRKGNLLLRRDLLLRLSLWLLSFPSVTSDTPGAHVWDCEEEAKAVRGKGSVGERLAGGPQHHGQGPVTTIDTLVSASSTQPDLVPQGLCWSLLAKARGLA